MRAWHEQKPFRELVEADKRITSRLSGEGIEDAFDVNHHTRQVDTLFHRVGLE
jgi:adenylosuccinate lyase